MYATDLWIGATENYERFKDLGLADRIIPIHADGNDLPFAHNYFDTVISVDASYYYFGREAGFMDAKLAPFVKQGGDHCTGFPGIQRGDSCASPGRDSAVLDRRGYGNPAQL